MTVKLGCGRLGAWPCNSSFRSEVALQGTAAHPAAGRGPRRPRSRSEAMAAEPGYRPLPLAPAPKVGERSDPLRQPVRRVGEGLRPRPGEAGGGRQLRPGRPRPVHTPGALAPGNLQSSCSRWDPGREDARVQGPQSLRDWRVGVRTLPSWGEASPQHARESPNSST